MTARFGDNLRRFREAKGWSQARLAKAAKFKNQGTIAQYESKDRPPSPSTVVKLAAALDVHTADLLDGVVTKFDELRNRAKEPLPAPSAPEEFQEAERPTGTDGAAHKDSQPRRQTSKHAPQKRKR